MIKTVETIITQSGAITEQSLVLGTSGNMILLSCIAQTDQTGGVALETNGGDVVLTFSVSGQAVDGMQKGYPIFFLANNIKVKTEGFPDGTFINLILYYIDGATDNPLFTADAKFGNTPTTTLDIGPTVILYTGGVYNYNVKSVYVFTNSTSNNLSLLLQSPTFVAPISITQTFNGQNSYQLLSSPVLLNPASTLQINMTEAVDTRVFVSYTRLPQ